MNRLPAGVQLEIFTLLHQLDRVECLRVCRAWESIINSFCLLHTISITSRHQVKKLKAMFRLQPHHCKLVERVIIFSNNSMNIDIGELLSYLPALREVCVPTAHVTKRQIRGGAYKYMERYLESFTEYSGNTMITSLLEHNTYYRLKSLTVYKNTRFSAQELFNNLRNTPELTELRIGKCSISTVDIEILHEAAPSLQSVYLTDANIVANSARVSQTLSSIVIDSESITSMTTFSLNFNSETNRSSDIANFFRFIRKKYTNLTKLELNIIDELSEGRRSESYSLYNEVLQPYCQELGSSLKELSTFAVYDLQKLYKLLEVAGCQIENLNLEILSFEWNREEVGFTNQFNYIKKLTLRNLFCSTFTWLGDYTALKELNLSFSNAQDTESSLQQVELSNLVESIPNTVTAVTLSHLQLQFDKLTVQLPSIKKLELREITFSHGLDAMISKAFPQLQHIRLIQCQLHLNEFIHFDLRLNYLHVEDIRTKRNKPRAAILIRTTENNEERVYKQMKYRMGEHHLDHCLTRFDGTIYSQSKIIPYNSIPPEHLIIITCRSVKNVIY